MAVNINEIKRDHFTHRLASAVHLDETQFQLRLYGAYDKCLAQQACGAAGIKFSHS